MRPDAPRLTIAAGAYLDGTPLEVWLSQHLPAPVQVTDGKATCATDTPGGPLAPLDEAAGPTASWAWEPLEVSSFDGIVGIEGVVRAICGRVDGVFENLGDRVYVVSLLSSGAPEGDRALFDRITLRPRMNVPTTDMDLTVNLFGEDHFTPIIVAPK